MTEKTSTVTSYRYTISNWIARKNGIPQTFIAIQNQETDKGVQLIGRGTIKNHKICMICGKELTHDISRFLGIGPICSNNMYGYKLTEKNKEVVAKMIRETVIDTWLPKSVIESKEKTDEIIEMGETKPKPEIKPFKKASLKKGRIEVAFRFDRDVIAQIKTLSGRRWSPKTKVWTALKSFDNVESLISWEFDLDEELENWYKNNTETSSGNDLEIQGLQKELYPYQKDGVAYIQSRKGRALIGDQMGLGKTAQALSWLQLNPKAMPALIICPASLKLNWKKEVKMWMNNPSVTVLSGAPKKGLSTWKKSDIVIINYDILSKWEKEFEKVDFKTIVMDEVHYIKNSKAMRTKALTGWTENKNGKRVKHIGLCKNVPHILALSGTPIVNRPLEMFNALAIINPGIFPSFWQYAKRYCGAKHNGYGWDFNGASNTKELHEKLTKYCMIRRLKKDVLKDLPEKTRSVVPMPIDNQKAYDKAMKKFQEWLNIEEGNPAEAMVEIEHLKQAAVAGKIKSCIKWIEDFLENGEKLVVFGTHKSTLDMVGEAFPDISVKLDGSTSMSKRQENVDEFQNNPKCKLFIGNIKAAGVGITLTAASDTCFLELPWTPGDAEQAEDRVHRIGQEANSVTAWYLLAAETVEDDIAQLLDAKRKILDQVLDGKDTEGQSLLTELMKKYKGE